MAFSSAILTIIGRLKSYYNGNSYDATLNPGGFGAGGHRRNQIPMCQDISDVGVAIAGQADATAASAQVASDKATVATNMAGSAATSAQAAADLYDQFDDRFLGVKSSDPTKDNDGNDLVEGAIYWNNSTDARYKGVRLFSGGIWNPGAFVITGGVNTFNGRFGAVNPAADDYSLGQITGAVDAINTRLAVAAKATSAEAIAATDNTKYMTPATVAAEVLALAGFFKYTVFTAGGTFTKDPRTKFLFVEAIGGGGSGGAGTTYSIGNGGYAYAQGTGGCGGTYNSDWFAAANISGSVTVLIGDGGPSVSTTTTAQGNPGGTSKFGSLLAALGGSGGSGVSTYAGGGNYYHAAPTTVSGVNSSASSVTTVNVDLGSTFGLGGLINFAGGSTLKGGAGGDGLTGGISLAHGKGGGGNNYTGQPGSAPGGGGGTGQPGGAGSTVTVTGGAGARGEVRIWEFG